MLIFNDELYSSYLVITPAPGAKALTKGQEDRAAALIFAGAVATIDTILAPKKNGHKKKIVN